MHLARDCPDDKKDVVNTKKIDLNKVNSSKIVFNGDDIEDDIEIEEVVDETKKKNLRRKENNNVGNKKMKKHKY